jgi:outer membrane lipoprotein carrier protein
MKKTEITRPKNGRTEERKSETGKAAKKIIILTFSLFLAFFTIHYSLFTSCSFAAEQEDLVAKIQKAYTGMKDISGSFVQKSSIKDLKRTDTYKGRFFIKPPSLKWEYTGDKPQAIYVDKGYVMIHLIKEKQVFKSKFEPATYGQAPLALLAGFGEIRKEFDVTSTGADKISLAPKKAMGNITRIEITGTKSGFPISTLSIIDSLSNRVDITLTGVKLNSNLSDSIFKFVPPKNATIIEN